MSTLCRMMVGKGEGECVCALKRPAETAMVGFVFTMVLRSGGWGEIHRWDEIRHRSVEIHTSKSMQSWRQAQLCVHSRGRLKQPWFNSYHSKLCMFGLFASISRFVVC